MTPVWKALIAVCILLGAAAAAFAELHIREYAQARHERFYTGSDRDFLGEAFDWSGVGRVEQSGGTWARGTMITPRYFVSAEHYPPLPGERLTFYETNDPNGPKHAYVIDDWFYIPTYDGYDSDLYVGRLTQAIPESHNITHYPIFRLPADRHYLGREILVFGNGWRLGKNHISSIQDYFDQRNTKSRRMSYLYDETGGAGRDEAYLIVGDSGSPSFVAWEGELAIVGMHSSNGGDSPTDGLPSHDEFLPFYVDQLKAAIVGEFVGGETISLVPDMHDRTAKRLR